jgi:hypothetical protein
MTSRLPKIHDIKWINNDFGYQITSLGAAAGLKRGCIKIWYNDPAGRRVVDRALSTTVARRRIAQLMPLFLNGRI